MSHHYADVWSVALAEDDHVPLTGRIDSVPNVSGPERIGRQGDVELQPQDLACQLPAVGVLVRTPEILFGPMPAHANSAGNNEGENVR